MAQAKKRGPRSPYGFYAAGACWVLYALLFPLYRWFDFLIAGALSVGVYYLLGALLPRLLAPEPPPKTGDEDADAVLRQGRTYLERIRAANDAIPGAQVSARISRIEEVTERILAYVARYPAKAGLVRRFLGYYLPTLLKLLETYAGMDKERVRGQNIQRTMGEIEQILDVIVPAFEKQLDNLYADQALDITTDITVLEGMLAREGLAQPAKEE